MLPLLLYSLWFRSVACGSVRFGGATGIWLSHFISDGPSSEGLELVGRNLMSSCAQSRMPMPVDFSETPANVFHIFF